MTKNQLSRTAEKGCYRENSYGFQYVDSYIDVKYSIFVSDNVAMRGERLELLVNKTENLSASSVTFRTQSRNLQRSLFWKNIKLYVIFGVVFAVSI